MVQRGPIILTMHGSDQAGAPLEPVMLEATPEAVEWLGPVPHGLPQWLARLTGAIACPYHTEQTPSCVLSERDQQWCCFGCQAHGVFTVEGAPPPPDRHQCGVLWRLPSIPDHPTRQDPDAIQAILNGFLGGDGPGPKGGVGKARQYILYYPRKTRSA
jgi:hypothetical protein